MGFLTRPGSGHVLDAMVDYLVDTPDGPVGILDGWERDERGRPRALTVAQGWFGRRRLEIPLEKLLAVDHEHRRVLLARDAAPREPGGLLQRLIELGRSRSIGDAARASPGSPLRARPVLCGVADDRLAATVVAVAARLAGKLAAPLVVAHVLPARVPPGVSATPDGRARLREEATDHVCELLLDALLSGLVSGIDVRRVVARGAPAAVLEELAGREGAQLLVIGSTGALSRGGVSHPLVGRAPCPVVVVPPEPTLRPPEGRGRDAVAEAPAGVGFDRAG